MVQALVHTPKFVEWCAANGGHVCPKNRRCVTCSIMALGCRFIVAQPGAALDPMTLRLAVAEVTPPNFALKTKGDAIEAMECILDEIHHAGDKGGQCTRTTT